MPIYLTYKISNHYNEPAQDLQARFDLIENGNNMAIPLNLISFDKAMFRLDEALQAFASAPTNTLYRDAAIQRFEFTYELAHKMLKRYLELTAANPAAIDEMAFADMIRTGSEQGLLRSGWDKWKDYRKARGTTSHTYDEAKAVEVAAVIPDFLQEARFLFAQLHQRSQSDK
jgi:nucleotidyltransferase substrate binding protein (TIGR01987 family)